MIALDTNVVVRYLVQDDDAQLRAVLRMLSRKGAAYYLCDLVLSETDWVLRSLYDWTAAQVAEAFARLTTVHNLVFENESRLRSALRALRDGASGMLMKPFTADEFGREVTAALERARIRHDLDPLATHL